MKNSKEKTCINCGVTKSVDYYYQNRNGYSNSCKLCYYKSTIKTHLIKGKELYIVKRLNEGQPRQVIAKEIGVNIQTLGDFIKNNIKIEYSFMK